MSQLPIRIHVVGLLISLCLAFGLTAQAGPMAPFVPGEMIVKVRVPVTRTEKGGAATYSIPPVLRKKIEAEGMLSAAALGGRTDKAISKSGTGLKSSHDKGPSAAKGVFLARFASDAPIKELAEKVSAIPGVEYAEPNYVGSLAAAPNDPLYVSKQKPVYDRIGLEQAWDVTTGSPDTIVAVLDSGIDSAHPDFAGRILPGHNFVEDSADTTDRLGHGTRVAGIIGARGNDGVGMTGVCWDCRLLPIVVAQANASVTVDVLLEAIDFAWRQGADVINLSLVVEGNSKALESACAIASRFALLVAAAGNEGQNLVERYPAAYESVVSVGAVDGNNKRASFSNYNLPGVNDFVDLVAPGIDIFSSIPSNKYDGANGRGTSFSAPIVSGVAALLRTKYPNQSTGAIRGHLESNSSPLGNFVRRGLVNPSKVLSSPLKAIFNVPEVTIRDGTDLNPLNDGDSTLDGGETAEIVIELENEGADLDSFMATLSTSSADITVVTGTAVFPSLPNGSNRRNLADTFWVEVAAGALQSTATFALLIPGADVVTFTVPIENEAPMPQVIDTDLTLGPEHTWIITGPSAVMAGSTLTVEAGTTVKFEANGRLEVWGGISSVGTQSRRVSWRDDMPLPMPLFSGRQEYPVETGSLIYPQAVGLVAADVTRDGLPDLLLRANDRISLLAGDGEGRLLPAKDIGYGDPYTNYSSVIASDLDGDGAPEVVAVSASGISIFRSDDNGMFISKPDNHDVSYNPNSVIAADLTGDGLIDLLTVSDNPIYPWHSVLSLLAADGSGGFSPEMQIPLDFSNIIRHVYAADLTSDGAPDLIMTDNYYRPTCIVLLNDGRGGFQSQSRYYDGDTIGEYTFSLVPRPHLQTSDATTIIPVQDYSSYGDFLIVDVNDDDILDFVGFGSDATGARLQIFTGDGKGGFLSPDDYDIRSSPLAAVACDITGNGAMDIVVIHQDGIIRVYSSNRSTAYSQQTRFSVLGHPLSVTAADVTGDGNLDLVTVNDNAYYPTERGSVTVLRGDGTGSFEQNFGFTPPWQYYSNDYPDTLVAADLTGDGVLDLVEGDTTSSVGFVGVLVGDGAGEFLSEAVYHDGDSIGDFIVHSAPRWYLHKEGTAICYSLSSQLVFADFTQDGILDMVANPFYGTPGSFYKGTGNGEFLAPINVGFVGGNTFRSADVTGDGIMDLLVLFSDSRIVQVYAGLGNGSFVPGDHFQTGNEPSSFIAVDVSADGVNDLIVVNKADDDLYLFVGVGEGHFLPPIIYPVGNGPTSVISADVTGNQITDLVISNGYANNVTVLEGDGRGGFGPYANLISHSPNTTISFSDFLLSGQVIMSSTCVIINSTFSGVSGPGLACLGGGLIERCSAVNCTGLGFNLLNFRGAARELSVVNTRGTGLICSNCESCSANGNEGGGILSLNSLVGCSAYGNGGIGLYAEETVSDSIAINNGVVGIQAKVVLDSIAADNYYGTGIVATERVEHCTAIANANGIEAPEIIDSLIIDSLGSALAGVGSVDGSRIVRNQSLHSFGVRFKDTVLDGNGGDNPVDEVTNMYIAGNEGGGVSGVPISFSTIVGNNGPGISNSDSVIGCNIAFNQGPGVQNSTVSSSYLVGNKRGNAVNSSVSFPQNQPVGEAPPFLMEVMPYEEFPLGIGEWGFEFIFSVGMNITKVPDVSFDLSSPFTGHILSASPGWTDSRTWRGSFTITTDIPDGTHTFRVARAVSLDGFVIPTDAYHQFRIDKRGGLQLSNGQVIGECHDGLTMSWDPSEAGDVIGFSIVRSGFRAGPYSLAGSTVVSVTHFTDTGLIPETAYFYKVYEYDSGLNKRELTNPFSGRTLVAPTPTISPTVTETGSPTATASPTETETASPTATASPTETETASPTATASPTETGTATPTSTASPTESGTATPTVPPNYDLYPPGGDGQVDARDLLEMLKAIGDDQNTMFDFGRYWKP